VCEYIIQIFERNKEIPINIIELLSWTMSNLCKYEPQPPLSKISKFIPLFAKLIHFKQNLQAIIHALWGLTYIADRVNESVKDLFEGVNLVKISEYIQNENVEIAAPALRILGNISSGGPKDVDLVISSEGLSALKHIVLQNNHPNLLKEACWVLSNIAAGPSRHVEPLISLSFIEKLSFLICEGGNFSVQREAGWAICNAFSEASPYQIVRMIDVGALEAIVVLLDTSDASLLLAALNAVKEALSLNQRTENQVTELFEKFGGDKKLEALQMHKNMAIYNKVIEILNANYVLEEQNNEI